MSACALIWAMPTCTLGPETTTPALSIVWEIMYQLSTGTLMRTGAIGIVI